MTHDARPWAWYAGRKDSAMTTNQILSAAYAEIFSLKPTGNGEFTGTFYGQTTGDCEIDYAHFDSRSTAFEMSADYFETAVEDGSEGCWIRVDLIHDHGNGVVRSRVGTIKTLAEGRGAWRDMGALAGELAYVANSVIAWRLYKAECEKEGK